MAGRSTSKIRKSAASAVHAAKYLSRTSGRGPRPHALPTVLNRRVSWEFRTDPRLACACADPGMVVLRHRFGARPAIPARRVSRVTRLRECRCPRRRSSAWTRGMPLREHPLHHVRRAGVGFQAVRPPPAPRGVRLVRVRPRITQPGTVLTWGYTDCGSALYARFVPMLAPCWLRARSSVSAAGPRGCQTRVRLV